MARTLPVEGVTCEHCEQTVEAALDGDEDAIADRDSERVTVAGDADTDHLVAAVEDEGYEASA